MCLRSLPLAAIGRQGSTEARPLKNNGGAFIAETQGFAERRCPGFESVACVVTVAFIIAGVGDEK